MQNKDKQPPTLPTLLLSLQKLYNPDQSKQKTQPPITPASIDDMIKKLQRNFQDILNSTRSQQKMKEQFTEKIKDDQNQFMQIVNISIQQIIDKDNTTCLDWLISIIRFSTTVVPKTQSIYQLTKQVQQASVIALPYDVPGPVMTVSLPDSVAQHQVTQSKAYFEEDQQIVTKYFQSAFYVVKRQGISEFATNVVQHLCKNLIEPFIKNPIQSAYSFETYLKFIQFLQQISPPIYTYYLLSCFKDFINKISQFMLTTKITKSINNQKINKLIYNLSAISSRWEGSVYYSKTWQWQLKQKIILSLILSNVSQTKLTGVKILTQFCRKVQYSSFKQEDVEKYIRQNGILENIFSADNHPQIISKGKQIYQFLCKNQILQQPQINILLNLIDKSHENIRKSIYLILQSLGQNNLTIYHRKILNRIIQLGRASFFSDQTLQLLETLLVIAPASQIRENMGVIYDVIRKFYTKLRKHLREKLVRLYFELFIMGVQEGIFVQDDKTNVIAPIGQTLGTNLSALMLDSFIKVIKNQLGKHISEQCKQILQESIYALFHKYKIHKSKIQNEINLTISTKQLKNNYKEILMTNPLFYSKQIHLHSVKFLLDLYEGDRIPISYEELCELIEEDISFTKFIQYYDKQQQIQAISTMLLHPNKNSEHLANIVQVYSLISTEAKQEVFNKIQKWLIQSKDFEQKIKLGQFVSNNLHGEDKLKTIYQKILQTSQTQLIDEMKLLSYLILLKNLILKQDKKGFGDYLPFSYSSNIYDILVKVTNSIDVLKPFQYQITAQSYETLSQVVFRLLQKQNRIITELNFKVNQKYISISDLQLKIGELAKKINKNESSSSPICPDLAHCKYYISITILDSFQQQWFDKFQLVNQGILNHQVIIALSQIFTKYTNAGKMYRSDSVRVFEMATESEKMTVNDSRIDHLYSHYSLNGEYLTLEQWLNFYQKSSQDNPALVINNLRKLGYGHLFKNQKDLLSEFDKNQINYARKFIVESGHQLYEILFKKYQNPKMNKYCQQLLQLLPIQPLYLQQHSKQNLMQQQQHQNKKISINLEKLLNHLQHIGHSLKNSRELWYIVSLLAQVYKNQKSVVEKSIANVIIILVKILEEVLKTEQFGSVQIEILGVVATMIMSYYQENKLRKLPRTLIDQKRITDISFQADDQLEDPLTLLNYPQNIILPQITFKKIQTLTQKLPTTSTTSSQPQQQKLIKLIDKLLLIYLLKTTSTKNQNKQQKQELILCRQLVFCNVFEIRSMFNNFYFLMCEIEDRIKTQYYGIDLDQENFDEGNMNGKRRDQHRFDQFFKTLNKILRIQSNQNEISIYSKVSKSIQHSIHTLITAKIQTQHKFQPTQKSLALVPSIAQSTQQNILLGKLTILDSIKVFQPDLQIINPQQWLQKLLQQPFSNLTRSLLYRMSQKLCPIQFNLKLLSSIMNGVIINKNSQIRKNERMGLFNLGCICYINSTIQQLFMIQPFRQAIISTSLIQQNQNLQYFQQFQYMIYQLTYGKRQFFIPDNFCLTYTDFQNKPIDIKQQHDADQFLNSLFDRLEKTLNQAKHLPRWISQMIRNNFCGQLANVITCQSCFNNRVKIQDFYVLTLEIKNNKNLMECFEKLTEPEIITDYYCDKCQKKVQSIQKQLSIKKLPKFLFLHLQRLVFDLQSLSKIKLQHLVDYPEELDLSEFFSSEFCDQQRGKYRLKGFIVHIGTSESGHYYSLVKQGGKWIKFDDSRVDQWVWDNYSREKQSTYILIYEKIEDKLKAKQQILPVQQSTQIGNPHLLNKVKLDNLLLIKQVIFLQKSFGRHLIQTLSRIQIPQQLLNSSPNQLETPFHLDHHILTQKHKLIYQQAHDIILDYLRLVSQCKSVSFYQINPEQIKNVTCYLILLLHIYPGLTQKTTKTLLKSPQPSKITTQNLRTILTHNDKTIRQAYKLIFTKILSIMTYFAQNTLINYFIPTPPHTQFWYIQKVLEYMLGSLYDAAKNYSKMEEHFQFVGLVMGMSGKVCEWFQQQNLGPKLIHFICSDQTPMKDQLPSYNYQNPKKSQSIPTISKILKNLIKIYLQKPNTNTYDQSNLNYKAYYSTKWYMKIYESRYNFVDVNQALVALIEGNMNFGRNICGMVVQKLNRFSHQDQYILAYVDLMQKILSIQDQYTNQRTQTLLGIPRYFLTMDDNINNQNTRYYKYWLNQFTNSDQFLLPILELLYINRYQINYFTLSTTTALLNCILKYEHIHQYIFNLPAPIPLNFYTDWIDLLLKCGLKEDVVVNGVDKKVCLNQIAQLLNCVQQKYQYVQEKVEESQQQIMNLNQQQKQLTKNRIKILQNPQNKLWRLWGKITPIQTHTNPNNTTLQYKSKITIIQDENNTKLIKYQFQLNPTLKKCILQFKLKSYRYRFVVRCRDFQVIVPYTEGLGDFGDGGDLGFVLQVIQKRQQIIMMQNKQKQHTNSNKQQNIQYINDDIKQQQQQASNTNTQQNIHNDNQQIFECPFCTSISFSFSTRCPVCGQEWGQMM